MGRGGNVVPRITEAEHIGPADTGDNIEAKRVALYVWNGTEWERWDGVADISGDVTVNSSPTFKEVPGDTGETPKYGHVDASGDVQVDVLSSALPTGAATAAKQLPDNHQVTVSNFPSTQPVSAASLPLPTGAATGAKQDTGNTSLSNIDTNIADIEAQSSRFKRIAKAEPSVGEELRFDDIAGGDLYIGAAVDSSSTSTGNLWDVVRYYRSATGVVTRARFRTGINWDSRTSGW